MLEHPEIAWIERTGYPSWMQESRQEEEEAAPGEAEKETEFHIAGGER